MATQEYLKRAEAAKRCGVSVDTIRRAQNDNKFPNIKKDDTTWMIPVSDLVAAGFLDPSEPRGERVDIDELESARQKIAHLIELLDSARDEVTFLRSVVKTHTAAGAAA